MSRITVGSIVRLKKGHTPMYVHRFNKNQIIARYCQGYDDTVEELEYFGESGCDKVGYKDEFVLVTKPGIEFHKCDNWADRMTTAQYRRLSKQISEAENNEEDMTDTENQTKNNMSDVITAIHVKNGIRFYTVKYEFNMSGGVGKSQHRSNTYMYGGELEIDDIVFVQYGKHIVYGTIFEIDVEPELGSNIQYKWILGDASHVIQANKDANRKFKDMVRALTQAEAQAKAEQLLERIPGAEKFLSSNNETMKIEGS